MGILLKKDNEAGFSRTKQLYTGNKLYLLKDGESVVVENGKVQVLGEQRVITK